MTTQNTQINVLGHQMNVVRYGSGDPILFLHGNPSHSYLWRNIHPYVKDLGEVIAPDLLGMGSSDKLTGDYSFATHYAQLEALITQLKLTNITLVLHDWGSGLGFHYFNNHPQNVKAIVFMEGIIQDIGEFFPADTQEFFTRLRSDEEGWSMIGEQNLFLDNVLPTWVHRPLTQQEHNSYKAPFADVESRRVIHQWVKDVPMHGKPEKSAKMVEDYRTALQNSDIPKLFFYATPGAFMPKVVADWIIANLPNLKSVFVGDGVHFIQEDHADLIGKEMKEWIKNLPA